MTKKVNIDISEEYLLQLCDWILKWAEHEDSLIIPQFLKEKGIGWSYFNHFLNISPKFLNAYETVLAILCNRWFEKGLKKNDLTPHMQKIFIKYLSLYDQNSRHITNEDKKEINDAQAQSMVNYESENYADSKLDDLYQKIYEVNSSKK